MVVDRVHTESDDLAIPPLELRHQPRHIAEFGCADRREILRMGEQDRPPIADPVVETDVSLGRFGAESGTSALILSDMMPLPRLTATL